MFNQRFKHDLITIFKSSSNLSYIIQKIETIYAYSKGAQGLSV